MGAKRTPQWEQHWTRARTGRQRHRLGLTGGSGCGSAGRGCSDGGSGREQGLRCRALVVAAVAGVGGSGSGHGRW